MVSAFFFDTDDVSVRSNPGHHIDELIFRTGILQDAGERLVVRGGDLQVRSIEADDFYEALEVVLGGPPSPDGRPDHGGLLTEWAYEVALQSTLFVVAVHGVSAGTARKLDKRLRRSSTYRGRKHVVMHFAPHRMCLHDQLEDRYFVHGSTVLLRGPKPHGDEPTLPRHRIETLSAWGFATISTTPESFRQLLGPEYDAIRAARRPRTEAATSLPDAPSVYPEVSPEEGSRDMQQVMEQLMAHSGPTLDELEAIFAAAYCKTHRLDDDELAVYTGHPYYLHVHEHGLVRIAAFSDVREGIDDDVVLRMVNDFNRRRYIVKCYYLGEEDRTLVFETDLNTEGGLVPEQLVARLRGFERVLIANHQFHEVLIGAPRVEVEGVGVGGGRVVN